MGRCGIFVIPLNKVMNNTRKSKKIRGARADLQPDRRYRNSPVLLFKGFIVQILIAVGNLPSG